MSPDKSTDANRLGSLSRRHFLATAGAAAATAALPIGTASAQLAEGTIMNSEYWWVQPGAPQTGNDYALRLKDNPESDGIQVNEPFEAQSDLTVDFYWRHHSSGSSTSPTYMWNDLGSGTTGFRAFTNGVGYSGFYFRNVFGGADIDLSNTNYQDGEWHHVRLILDSSTEEYLVYVDGSLAGQAFYDGSGFSADASFRICGRDSTDGSGDEIEYDRFVMTDEAIYLEDELFPASDQLHFELEEGEGDTVGNEPGDPPERCIDRRYWGRGTEEFMRCEQSEADRNEADRERSREDGGRTGGRTGGTGANPRRGRGR